MNDLSQILKISDDDLAFIRKNAHVDPVKIRLSTSKKSDRDYPFLVAQIEARKRLSSKLPEWLENEKVVFPDKVPLEQASSQITATYKAQFCSGKIMADLTGGLGVDSFYLAKNFEVAHYCERNTELAAFARHNFEVLNAKNILVHALDGLEFLKEIPLHFDLIYLDPARRGAQNQKVFLPQDCEPDYTKHLNFLLSKTKKLVIKLSPLADISLLVKMHPDVSKITVLSLSGDVKELLLEWDNESTKPQPVLHLAHYQRSLASWQSDELTLEKPVQEPIAKTIGKYLIEPYPAWMKSIFSINFGLKYHVEKLHHFTHLYTANQLEKTHGIPGHIYQIIDQFTYNKKCDLPEKANIKCRNFNLSAEELAKRHKVKPGGDVFVIAAGLEHAQMVFVCKAISTEQ